ncbi:sodium-dependent transporter [Entomospira entomophila]|uniref:Sodium-dependent transporter n=1 Tax=Entomospira entomophila TaxID=2719988 RepID=A0A968GEZ5_9SPIO|nr:sodium-dependent transporter [Entomospira entomophilus]NIZ41224.1 sodium-dependent transporter [Entomospira entomophilus]WDI35430.1 sodium-dependent transporter [Entomospira entomophilus]
MASQKDEWSSHFGFLMAAIASAVGLGSIWRFPYLVGSYGGSAFIIMYTLLVIIVGVLGLAVEIAIGRNGGTDAVHSYTAIEPKSKFFSYIGIFTGFIIMTFYSLIGGWILYYLFISITFSLSSLPINHFDQFIASDTPLYWQLLFIGLTSFIIMKGVTKGIEKYSKSMNILLFILIVVITVRSVTLPNSIEGIRFLINPDFSIFKDKSVWLMAIGQAFFSLSLGMAIMVTYGCYVPKSINIAKSSFVVALSTLFIAILMGFAIFPAVFAFGFDPASGPGLLFNVLPQVFAKMNVGGPIFAILFFIATFFAAITSTISLIEPVIARTIKVTGFSRIRSTLIVTMVLILVSIPVAFSFGRFQHITIFGNSIFDALDFVTDKILLPFNAIVTFILAGWFWKSNGLINEITNQGSIKIPFQKISIWMIKVVLPALIGILLMSNIKPMLLSIIQH